MIDNKPQIQEAQITPSKINTKKSILWHIFKLQKIKGKDKILKDAKEEKKRTMKDQR